MTTLSPDHFAAFFRDIHGHDPFPWQRRLAARVAERGAWPDQLVLPTGAGKTAAIDVAVFHLALEADRGPRRRAPVRIAFVVDRRLVVDDAFTRAEAIARALDNPKSEATALVAERLKRLSGEGAPALLARRLRGGIPREEDWARGPAQPTVLCSTVDQVGSRLLFRGYGLSDAMKPVHAGLIGADCLILLDEAHLAEPFRQTLDRVKKHRQAETAPWGLATLTATPREAPREGTGATRFDLEADDHANPVLAARWSAAKPVRLHPPAKGKAEPAGTDGSAPDATPDATPNAEAADEHRRVAALADEARKAVATLREQGIGRPAVGVVVNRVGRARRVFERLQTGADADTDILLMIGPTRAAERDAVVERLTPLRTRTWADGEARALDRAIVVVATQCLEAGADIDLDGLVTEAAPLDALRQRFGRLNRAGRPIVPYGAILAGRPELSSRHDDPVYGRSIKAAWEYLTALPSADFGPKAFDDLLARHPPAKEPSPFSPTADAPVLMPAHIDLFSQTAPVPAQSPETALFLHGPVRQPDAVSVIWRADVLSDVQDDEALRRLLLLVPPRSAEAVELPLWTVRRWLEEAGRRGPDRLSPDRLSLNRLADLPAAAPEDATAFRRSATDAVARVLRWAGDDEERSCWIPPAAIRPGDTIVVPAARGGLDAFGWNPESRQPVADVAAEAAEPFAGRRFAVRVAPGLLHGAGEEADTRAARLGETLAAVEGAAGWKQVRDAVLTLDLPDALRTDLGRLDKAKGSRGRVEMHRDLYGTEEGHPRGIVFVARLGLADAEAEGADPIEDDIAGSLPGFPLTLAEHSGDVEKVVTAFARAAGLLDVLVADLAIAGWLHDLGKMDERFQRWLASGDPLGGDPLGGDPDRVLAKSGRLLPRNARARAGLPPHWRHEALSVRLAAGTPRLREATDPDLVLWLVGTHHGHGRPLFPHADERDAEPRAGLPPVLGNPTELPPGSGPQSLGFDWNGLDWAGLFDSLKARHGVWGLARLEAVLRLADQHASAMAAKRKAADTAADTAADEEGDAA